MSNKFANGKSILTNLTDLMRTDIGKHIKVTQGLKGDDPNPSEFTGTLTNINYTPRGIELEIEMENGKKNTIFHSNIYDYEIIIPTTFDMDDSEDKENVPRNIAKPFDAMRYTEDIRDARAKNRTSLKTSMDELTTNDIRKQLTITETSKYNRSNTKSYTGTLKYVSTDDYGNVGYINILDSEGRERTISNLGDSYNYTITFLTQGGLKHSNSRKRKRFSRKRNKKSLKKRNTKRTLKYKR